MRRRTLHRTTVATAAAATVLLAGCGAADDGKGPDRAGTALPATTAAASASPTPSSSGSVPPSVSPSAPHSATPSHPAGCAAQAELGTADSGRTVCLAVGGRLTITLDGTRDRPWTPVRATGTALKGADAGIVIMPGDALAAYTAAAPGTARLTASRPLCPTGPGKVSCKAVQEWTVTVRVTRP